MEVRGDTSGACVPYPDCGGEKKRRPGTFNIDGLIIKVNTDGSLPGVGVVRIEILDPMA